MNTIKFAGLLSISAVLLLAGCGKNKTVQLMEETAEKACACKDIKCMDGLMKDEAVTKAAKENPPTSEGDAKAVAAATMKMTECMTKLAGASMPAMPK